MIRALHLTLLLFALSLASFLWWHHTDSRPSSMDETRHMKLALDYKASVFQRVPLSNTWSHVYPPLFHASLIPGLSFGVPSEMKAAAVNLVYLAALVAGFLLLGKRAPGWQASPLGQAGRPAWESVAAAFLCAGYCSVLWAGRRALIDFALMSWVTLAIGLLANTDGFYVRRTCMWWGVVCGTGLLLKLPFAFCLVLPVLWTLFRQPGPGKYENFWTAIGVALAISLPWYFWEAAYFLDKGSRLAGEITASGTDPRTLEGWLFYPRLLREQLGLPGLAITLAGMAVCLVRRPWRENVLPVLWILSGYLILSSLMNKDPRHTLPILPALALLAVRGWASVSPDSRSGPAAGRIAYGGLAVALAMVGFFVYQHTVFDRPAVENWKHGQILRLLAQRREPGNPYITASVISHHPRFFARTLVWSGIQRGIPLETISPGRAEASFPEFVITRTGDQGSERAHLEKQWQSLTPGGRTFKSVFREILRTPLPDSSEAVVYQRQAHVRYAVTPLTLHEVERRIAAAVGRRLKGTVKVTATGSPEALAGGRLKRLKAVCSPCRVDGLKIRRLEITLEKPRLNLYRLWDEGQLGLLALESLTPKAEIRASDVAERLRQEKQLGGAQVQFADNQVRVGTKFRGRAVGAVAQVGLETTSKYPGLSARLKTISIDPIGLPGWLLGRAHRQTLPLYPVPSFPARIEIKSIQLQDDVLKIN